jgi:mannose-6-phosphate isomerase-like protein (cupin superfamily)
MSHPHTSTQETPDRTFVLGQALRATILATAEETHGHLDLMDCVQPPDAATPLHMHTRYEERYWVISGTMTVYAGSDQATLGPGDHYVVPTNVPHMVRFGPEGTRALVFSSPAGFAELVARTGTPAHLGTPETELDTDRFMAVSTELGDVVLGPPGTTPAELANTLRGGV